MTPWTVAHQAPQSMGFSRQEYWSGLPFPSPGDLPNPGIKPRSPALQVNALTSEPPGKPLHICLFSVPLHQTENSWMTGPICLFHHSVLSQGRSRYGQKETLLPDTLPNFQKTNLNYSKTIKMNSLFCMSLLKPFPRPGFPGLNGTRTSLSNNTYLPFLLHLAHAVKGSSLFGKFLFIFLN